MRACVWRTSALYKQPCLNPTHTAQELTARTHFRGQVRKRLIPFLCLPAEGAAAAAPSSGAAAAAVLGVSEDVAAAMGVPCSQAPEAGARVSLGGKAIGKVVAGINGVGLAMIRLQFLLDAPSRVCPRPLLSLLRACMHAIRAVLMCCKGVHRGSMQRASGHSRTDMHTMHTQSMRRRM